jgi:catechol 2,3-dioxygenase-like lactoylglutathione lyase family enzyme
VKSLFPDVCSDHLAASRDFYRALLGFEVVFENEWYVQLRAPREPAVQIAFVERGHASVPGGHGRPPQGVLVTVELEDVDACHARAEALGCELVYPLRSESWGQSHFMVLDPNGLLVDVVQLIPPAPEYRGFLTES